MSAIPPDAAGTWLVRGDDVLAALGPPPPSRLVGRPPGPAAVLRRAVLVHTLGGDGLDVAWCRATAGGPGVGAPPGPGPSWEVARTRTLAPRRAVLARPGRGAVLVAPAGAFERWALCVGDRVDVAGA